MRKLIERFWKWLHRKPNAKPEKHLIQAWFERRFPDMPPFQINMCCYLADWRCCIAKQRQTTNRQWLLSYNRVPVTHQLERAEYAIDDLDCLEHVEAVVLKMNPHLRFIELPRLVSSTWPIITNQKQPFDLVAIAESYAKWKEEHPLKEKEQ